MSLEQMIEDIAFCLFRQQGGSAWEWNRSLHEADKDTFRENASEIADAIDLAALLKEPTHD